MNATTQATVLTMKSLLSQGHTPRTAATLALTSIARDRANATIAIAEMIAESLATAGAK